MTDVFRSITHGTCALNGRHSSAKYASECPALGLTPEERLARFRGVSITLSEAAQGSETLPVTPAVGVRAPSEHASRTRMNSGDSSRVSITRAREGARRGGRPRKHASARIARREASRAYRTRQKDGDAPSS
jgi:hypothetical protein